jgi:hypothetical protein
MIYIHRSSRIKSTLITTAIFLILVSAPLFAQTPPAGCDEQALADAKQSFNELRLQYIKDPSTVDELEFRLAASDYIGLAEECYYSSYGADPGGQMIDEGGVWMTEHGIQTNFDSGDYVLWGTKWGAGSPFTDGTDLPGPQITGGTVTYSFMADAVDLSAEGGPLSNVALTSLATYSPCFLDEIELALGAWSAVADILFFPVTDGGEPFNDPPGAHIRIGAHTFDGASGTLAHAFFPPPNGNGAAGDTHFDSEEIWACTPGAGNIALGLVALHEFGHAIGLGHEMTDIAVMNPFYNPALTFGPLADDIMGAGEIYDTAGAATTTHFGNVGIGTDTPEATLHTVGSDGATKILVEEKSATAAPRTLFQLKNNGNTKFGVHNTEADVEWAFANPGTAFRLSRQGSGEVEMEIFNNGNVTIAGDLTQNSDVHAKTAITDVNPQEILARVSELPVSKWEYKDAPGEDHIGPMAQDFYAAFGLGGSQTGISTIDASGVALAAIKALAEENRMLKAENAALDGRLEQLERQQAGLQVLMTRFLENQQAQTVLASRTIN